MVKNSTQQIAKNPSNQIEVKGMPSSKNKKINQIQPKIPIISKDGLPVDGTDKKNLATTDGSTSSLVKSSEAISRNNGEAKENESYVLIKKYEAKIRELEDINQDLRKQIENISQKTISQLSDMQKSIAESTKCFLEKYSNKNIEPIDVIPANEMPKNIISFDAKSSARCEPNAVPNQLEQKSDQQASKKVNIEVIDRIVGNKTKPRRVTDPNDQSVKLNNEKPEDSPKVNLVKFDEIPDELLSPPELAARLTRQYTNILKSAC